MITNQDTHVECSSTIPQGDTKKSTVNMELYRERLEEVMRETQDAMEANGWSEEHNG